MSLVSSQLLETMHEDQEPGAALTVDAVRQCERLVSKSTVSHIPRIVPHSMLASAVTLYPSVELPPGVLPGTETLITTPSGIKLSFLSTAKH